MAITCMVGHANKAIVLSFRQTWQSWALNMNGSGVSHWEKLVLSKMRECIELIDPRFFQTMQAGTFSVQTSGDVDSHHYANSHLLAQPCELPKRTHTAFHYFCKVEHDPLLPGMQQKNARGTLVEKLISIVWQWGSLCIVEQPVHSGQRLFSLHYKDFTFHYLLTLTQGKLRSQTSLL